MGQTTDSTVVQYNWTLLHVVEFVMVVEMHLYVVDLEYGELY
jgi:hypothetical protein